MKPASLVLDLVERVWNAGDVDALGDYYAETFEHDEGIGTLVDLTAWLRHDAATWAGTTYAVLDCIATDDAVALRWRATSTHVGPWGPVPTTGRRVQWIGAHFFRIEDGRIVAMHSLSDRFGKAEQLGVHMTPPKLPLDEGGPAQ
jgi:predicted ester cyclase